MQKLYTVIDVELPPQNSTSEEVTAHFEKILKNPFQPGETITNIPLNYNMPAPEHPLFDDLFLKKICGKARLIVEYVHTGADEVQILNRNVPLIVPYFPYYSLQVDMILVSSPNDPWMKITKQYDEYMNNKDRSRESGTAAVTHLDEVVTWQAKKILLHKLKDVLFILKKTQNNLELQVTKASAQTREDKLSMLSKIDALHISLTSIKIKLDNEGNCSRIDFERYGRQIEKSIGDVKIGLSDYSGSVTQLANSLLENLGLRKYKIKPEVFEDMENTPSLKRQ